MQLGALLEMAQGMLNSVVLESVVALPGMTLNGIVICAEEKWLGREIAEAECGGLCVLEGDVDQATAKEVPLDDGISWNSSP